MRISNHKAAWEYGRSVANSLTKNFYDVHMNDNFDAMKAGNISTDDLSWWEVRLFVNVTAWFVDELTKFYGNNPSAGVGRVQALHSCRSWTGHNRGLGYIESAFGACIKIRQTIIKATQNALECWFGNGKGGYEWIGHALHIIEDSFSEKHATRNDNMELLDFHTSSRDFAHKEEEGSRLKTVHRHNDGELDEDPVQIDTEWSINPLDWVHFDNKNRRLMSAALADAGYLEIVSTLIKEMHNPDESDPAEHLEKLKNNARKYLNEYFDGEKTVSVISSTFHGHPYTINGQFKIHGYFNTKHLSHEVPVYITSYHSSIERKWNIYAPFLLNNKPFYLAYETSTGDYRLYDFSLNEISESAGGSFTSIKKGEGNIFKNWTNFTPFETKNGEIWMLAYNKSDGNMMMHYVYPGAVILQLVSPNTSTKKVANFDYLVPIQDSNSGIHFLGYCSSNGHVSIGSILLDNYSPFSVQWYEGITIDKGLSDIRSFWLKDRLFIMTFNSNNGQIIIYEIISKNGNIKMIYVTTKETKDPNYKHWKSIVPFSTIRLIDNEIISHTYILINKSDYGINILSLDFLPPKGERDIYRIREGLFPNGRGGCIENSQIVPFYPNRKNNHYFILVSTKSDTIALCKWESNEENILNFRAKRITHVDV